MCIFVADVCFISSHVDSFVLFDALFCQKMRLCLFHCSHGIEKVEGELAKFERIQLFDSIQGFCGSSMQGRSEFESMMLLEHVFSCHWCV